MFTMLFISFELVMISDMLAFTSEINSSPARTFAVIAPDCSNDFWMRSPMSSMPSVRCCCMSISPDMPEFWSTELCATLSIPDVISSSDADTSSTVAACDCVLPENVDADANIFSVESASRFDTSLIECIIFSSRSYCSLFFLDSSWATRLLRREARTVR